MALLLRFLAIPVIWLFVRRHRSSRPALAGEIEKLSPNRQLKLAWSLAKDERVPLYARPLWLLPALYMASPIDVLPDFIPVVGKLDDEFVSSAASSLLVRLVPPALLREHLDLASR